MAIRQLLKNLLLFPSIVWVYDVAVRQHAARELRSLRSRLGQCGADLDIVYPWDVRCPEYVFISNDVFIGPGALIMALTGANITIGSKVMMGPRVRLVSHDHRFDDPGRAIKNSGYGKLGGIVIGDDVWIGAGATILQGVSIGDGAVIGAGSVVTKNVGPLEVWAGNPARKIRRRFETSKEEFSYEVEVNP